jgi:hypothetical protein
MTDLGVFLGSALTNGMSLANLPVEDSIASRQKDSGLQRSGSEFIFLPSRSLVSSKLFKCIGSLHFIIYKMETYYCLPLRTDQTRGIVMGWHRVKENNANSGTRLSLFKHQLCWQLATCLGTTLFTFLWTTSSCGEWDGNNPFTRFLQRVDKLMFIEFLS